MERQHFFAISVASNVSYLCSISLYLSLYIKLKDTFLLWAICDEIRYKGNSWTLKSRNEGKYNVLAKKMCKIPSTIYVKKIHVTIYNLYSMTINTNHCQPPIWQSKLFPTCQHLANGMSARLFTSTTPCSSIMNTETERLQNNKSLSVAPEPEQ